jgi:hypothetical protein
MSVGQPLRVLNLYDVLVNLIPGAVFLLAIVTLSAPSGGFSSFSSAVAIAIFVVLSYVTGHAIQWIGSSLDGTPQLFGDTMERIRSETGRNENLATNINISEIEEEFWKICATEFHLSEDFSNYGKLLQLITSRLETTSATRALRFQAIHSFHRSMWAVSISVILVTVLSIPINVALRESFPVVRYVVVFFPALTGDLIFGARKEKFNKKFIEYLIIDFYIIVTR